ncbi:hypothetical protein D3C71_1780060 [compost metagenome]
MPLHRKKRWNGTDRDLDTVGPAVWHRSGNGNHLIEAKRQVRAISFLYSKVADQRRHVLHDLRVPGHQEVDHHINGRPTIICLDLTHQLESSEFFALFITVAQQCFDQMDVFPVPKGSGVQA